MRSQHIHACFPLMGMAVLGALLAACGSPQSAAPEPASQAEAAAPVPEVAVAAPADEVIAAPVDAVVAAAPASVAEAEPELASMKLAQMESSKMGVPVDLRYQLDGDAMSGAPVTLHLAAVPRVEGTNLAVSIKEEAGIEFPKAALNAQKADAATAYRQQMQIQRKAGGPRQLRVLVTMDYPIGTGFSYFTVPLDGTSSPSKESNP